MLDDIAEGTIKIVFRFLTWLFFEVILFYTGEIVLTLLTLGRRKPRWDYFADESPKKFILYTDLSVLVGFVIWLFLFWFIGTKVFN
jgi:hypothetical protein